MFASEKRPSFVRERRRGLLAYERPFGLTIDPRYLFKSHSFVTALDTLGAAIARRDCCAVLTGEPGTGKTTVCRTLADQNDRSLIPALVLYPPSTPEELLTATLVRFGLLPERPDPASPPPSRQALLNTLTDFLHSVYGLGAPALLMLDEAQHMPPDVLDEVCGLANLTIDGKPLLQIVMAGQPSLTTMLQAPELHHVSARFTQRCETTPLTGDETAAYIRHRLGIADPEQTIQFAPDALELVYAYSEGIPRVVNVICHRALIAAQGDRASVVDTEMVTTAATDLELQLQR